MPIFLPLLILWLNKAFFTSFFRFLSGYPTEKKKKKKKKKKKVHLV